jgi:hypothetical protein
MLAPTRSCEGVRLELLCELQPPHIVTSPSCEALAPHICAERTDGLQPFLAMPPAYADDLSYLVLCRLMCQFIDGELNVTMQPINRKILLPVSVLQQFLQACVCQRRKQPTPPLVTDDTPPPGPIVEPDDNGDEVDDRGDIFIREPPRIDWRDLQDKLREEHLFEPRDILNPDDGVTDPPPFREDLAFFGDQQIIAKLDEAGVSGPVAFIDAEATIIAEATGLTISAIEKTKLALGDVRHLYAGPQF